MTNRDYFENEGSTPSRRRIPGADKVFRSNTVESEQTAIALRNTGEIVIGGYRLTPRGLVLSGETTKDNWERVGQAVFGLEGSIQWIIGDWLNDGERNWGKTFKEVAAETGRDVDTLYNYLYVASKVPFSLRNENLTFNHHYAVARKADSPEEQIGWLAMAAEQGWSVARLRAEMDAADPKRKGLPTPKDATRRVARATRKIDTFERTIASDLDGVGRKDRQPIIEKLELLLKRIRNGEI